MKAVIYKKIEQEVIKDWEELWRTSSFANYTNAPQWFLSVIEAFHYKDFAIIAIYQNEQMVAVGALVKEKKFGIDCYTVAPQDFACGIPFLFDFHDSKISKFFAEKLLDLGNIFLGNISEKFLNEFSTHTRYIKRIAFSLNYYLSLEKDTNNNVIIRNRKKLLNEARNVLEQLQFRTFNGDTRKGLDTIFDIDLQSRKQTRGYSTFSDNQIKGFYKILAAHFQKNFLVGILYFETKPIAYGMGFLVGSTFFYNQMAYLADLRQYSPGKVLMVRLIDYLGATKNIEAFDFGSGDSFVKKLITDESNVLYQVILSKNTFVLNYLFLICTLRKYAYDRLSKNMKTYTFYRRIKNILPL